MSGAEHFIYHYFPMLVFGFLVGTVFWLTFGKCDDEGDLWWR